MMMSEITIGLYFNLGILFVAVFAEIMTTDSANDMLPFYFIVANLTKQFVIGWQFY